MGRGIFYSLFAIIFLWIGSHLTPYTYDLYLKGKASETWVPVDAKVISYKIYQGRNTSSGYKGASRRSSSQVQILYHYQYDGVEYAGDQTGFGPTKAERPRRGQATIYVNPQTPSESVYTKGVSKNNLGGLAVGIGLIFAGLFFSVIAVKAIIKK